MNNRIIHQLNTASHIKASASSKWLLAHGISAITTADLAALLGIPINHIPQRMAALKSRNEIVTPTQGLWIPVPPEYQTWGAPPAIEIIDAMMSHLKADYYIGWLSAAELLGASHHAPQVFQVATSKAVRTRIVGRSRFLFFIRNHIKHVSLTNIETKSGSVPLSSRETTLLDICSDIGIVGGIDNAANLIIELCELSEIDMDTLITISENYPITTTRRLGFLLEKFTDTSDLSQLHAACEKRNAALSILDPYGCLTGYQDTRWRIKINKEVSPDV